MKNKNALLECTNCGKSLGPKTQSHLENQDNGDQRWSCIKPQTKTRCDGKTHYTPTGERNSVIGVCDCKPQTHTPTPWIQESFGEIMGAKEGNGIPRDFVAKVQPLNGFGRFVDSEKAKANAAFIVRAVNAYEKDQEIKKELLEALQAIRARIVGDFDNPTLMKYGALGDPGLDISTIADEAIAKAEGK